LILGVATLGDQMSLTLVYPESDISLSKVKQLLFSYRKLHAVVAESLVGNGMANGQTDRLYLMPLLPIMDVGENREATTDRGLSFFSVHDVDLIRLIPVRGEVKFSGYFLKISLLPWRDRSPQSFNSFGRSMAPARH
jgi:hypothetical protein